MTLTGSFPLTYSPFSFRYVHFYLIHIIWFFLNSFHVWILYIYIEVLFDTNTKSWSTPPSLIWMLVLPNIVFWCFWQIWVSGRGSFSLTFVSNRSVTTALFRFGSMCQWPIGHSFVCDTKAFSEIAFQIKSGSKQFEYKSFRKKKFCYFVWKLSGYKPYPALCIFLRVLDK